MPIVLKSGSLSLLEPLGPVQACNEIALPLPLLHNTRVYKYSIPNLRNNQEFNKQSPAASTNVAKRTVKPPLIAVMFL